MKGLIALFMLAASVSQAQDITLYTAGGAGALHQYHGVTDSVGDPVTMYLPQASNVGGGVSLWFDSEYDHAANKFIAQWRGMYSGMNGGVIVLQHCVYDALGCQWTGETMTVTLKETVRTVRGSGSGRGGYASHQVWTLVSGSISFP